MNSDLSKLIGATSNARLRLRLLAVSHFIDGKNRTEIASFLKVSRLSVNKWIKAYLDFGVEGLVENLIQEDLPDSLLSKKNILKNTSLQMQ